MSENPLVKQASLESLVDYQMNRFDEDGDIYDAMIAACYYAKAQGIDECVNYIDDMLNSPQINHMSIQELASMHRVLENMRVCFVSQRNNLIRSYDEETPI